MENIIEIKQLRKDFTNFSLKEISFVLPKGYIMGFIGPNGAGKSTTIKLMMNLLRKDAGEIRLFGLDHLKNELEIKNRVGFLLDENHFYEELSINEMVFIIAPYYKNWDNNTFQKYIKLFELPTKAKIKTLSKGMKMKFSLAVALSHNAELLIMDEPTSGLDPVVRNELLEILTALIQDENKAVFFSTHITSDLDKIADYITFINNGEIILSDSKDAIMDSYRLIKGDNKYLNQEHLGSFVGVKKNEFGFTGLVNDKKELAKFQKDEFIIERPTLEDIMLLSVRGNKDA